eukprot:378523_1
MATGNEQELGIMHTRENSISQTEAPPDSFGGSRRNINIFQDTYIYTAPSGDPSKWDWEEVQRWLRYNKLKSIIVLIEGEFDKDGIDGEELIHLDLNRDEHWITKDHQDFKKFQKALQKLRLKMAILDINDHETSVDDFIEMNHVEMNRRINFFIEKWDRILWIEHYFDTNSRLPTEEDICHA